MEKKGNEIENMQSIYATTRIMDDQFDLIKEIVVHELFFKDGKDVQDYCSYTMNLHLMLLNIKLHLHYNLLINLNKSLKLKMSMSHNPNLNLNLF